MSWIYNGAILETIPDGFLGFVYLIEHIPSGRSYLGKKLFWFTKTKMVNKKKKKVLVESDWQDYYSSSPELNELVKKDGKEAFKRTVLHLCKNKGTLSYLELREQMDNRVLENPAKWINGIIQCRINKSHVKL